MQILFGISDFGADLKKGLKISKIVCEVIRILVKKLWHLPDIQHDFHVFDNVIV